MNARRALALAPLLFGVWFFGVLAPYGIQPGEDGDLLYQAYATARGQLPYVDFSTGYTPLYFYWHAALFRVFGVDALWTRFAIAAANTTTLVLMYALAARVERPVLALLAPLAFVASLPVFPGEFASFNVPYPAWYNVTLWLGSLLAMAAHARQARPWLVGLAGLLAGASFSMKPNVGLFNLAALAFFLCWWQPPGRRDARLARLAWPLLALGALAGVVVVFRAQLGTRAFVLFPLPLIAGALILLGAAGRRRIDGSGFGAALAALAVGFAVPTLPWVLYFLARLGVDGFLRDVLLLGTSYERFFFIPYRELGTRFDVALLLIGVGLVAVPTLVRLAVLPAWVPLAGLIAAAGGAAALIAVAPMRAGFVASVTMRVQDLGFLLLQVVNWWGVFGVIGRVAFTTHRAPRTAVLVLLAISAPAFTLAMYPRSDFTHLLAAAPASIVLGTALIGRLAARWRHMAERGSYWRWLGSLAVGGPVAAIAAVMLVPGTHLAADMTMRYLGFRGPDAIARLDLPHASLVREVAAGKQLTVLRETAIYLADHSAPDDYVFPFPNLNLLCFLAGRLNPTAKGYFIAGYPDHMTEAGIVRALTERPPRLVVALRAHELFVTTASSYYFLVRELVQAAYRPTFQIGPYVVMAPKDVARPFDIGFEPDGDPDTWADLDRPDASVQRAATNAIRRERDPRGAAALARRALRGDSPHVLLFLQVAGEFGDERAVPALVTLIERDRGTAYDDPTGDAAARVALATSALYFIAEKSILSEYWFVPPDPSRRRRVLEDVDFTGPAEWLHDRDTDSRLRVAAAWMAGARGERAEIPYLLTLLGTNHLDMAQAAAYALVRLGQAESTAESLVALLHWQDLVISSLLLDLHDRAPEHTRLVVERGLQRGTGSERAALAWIAAATGDQALAPSLAALGEDVPNLRSEADAALALLSGVFAPRAAS